MTTRTFAHTRFESPIRLHSILLVDARWTAGPRVRVGTLRKGDRVLTIVGETEVYERVDGALSGCHHMASGAVYAGCAEVVRLDKGDAVNVPDGVDVTTSWEWRFRDPVFDAVWTRWTRARHAWRVAWEGVGDPFCDRRHVPGLPFNEGGPDSRYNPDPSKITNEKIRAAAVEYQAAREAYHAQIAQRST